MAMNEPPSVSMDIQDDEEYINISFEFIEGDFATNMDVSYIVQELAE